jgi:bZIP transcription factor
MASPMPLIQAYPSEPLLETPNFDTSMQDTDFNYFDTFNTASQLYGLDGADYSPANWGFPTKESEQVVDPILTCCAPNFAPSLDFGGSDLLSPAQELTPPPSAVEAKPIHGWPTGKISASKKAGQKPPAIDTQAETNGRFASRHGQITPPMSSKSPESESLAEPTATAAPPSKRGRKPSAKAAAKKEAAAPKPPPAKSTRKPRKGSAAEAAATAAAAAAAAEEQEEEVEPLTGEARAKRARFLERNRQAAFTCRQRKKQWAKDLEDRHRTLERENQNLKLVLVSLKDEFHYLRQQVVSHTTCECSGAREYIHRSSRVLAGERPAAAAGVVSGNSTAERLPSVDSNAAIPPPGLEQALRASLGQFECEQTAPRLKAADGMDFDGPELDGMTL